MKRDSPMEGLRRKAAEELRAWAETLETKKENQALAEKVVQRRQRRMRLGLLLGALALVWGAAAAYLFWPLRSDPLPTEALGTWQTTDARYADRTFEITTTTVTFRAAGMDMQYPIRRVLRGPHDEVHRFTIEYDDTGSVIALQIVLDPLRRALRFAHQPEVLWQPATP